MRREAQHVLLLLVGGALVKITLNGSYLRYVKPSSEPWLLAAGVIMVSLALIAIIADIRASRSGAPAAGRAHDTHGQGHGHRPARSSWLLMLPVLAIFLIAPPALGADAVLRSDSRAATPALPARPKVSALAPLPRRPVVPLDLSEFITRSVWDTTDSLRGRTVELTGFIVHDHDVTYLARLVITCCAADATPMMVRLAGGLGQALSNDQWVLADGTLQPGSATPADEYVPTLTVRGLTQIAQPADPYEY